MSHNFRWILLIALGLIMFIVNVDYTAVNLALIPMAAELHADINTIQWVLSGYVLAWAVLVIPAGNYADKHNKKYLCLTGLGLFLFASLLAGLAQSVHLLIAARILQGVAGAIYVPTLYALVYINFAEHERGRAMGLLSLGVGLGMAMGPFIGGVLLSLLNWRSIFFINIPLGLVAFAIIYASKKDDSSANNNPMFDKLSAILLGISTIIVIYIIGEWQRWTQNILLYSGLILIAILAIALFIKLQRQLTNPLIPLSLFSNLPFVGVSLGMLLEQFAFSTIIVAIGLYLQKVLLLSSLVSSLIYLALTVVFGIVALTSGPWIDKIGLRAPTNIGLFLLTLGSALFVLLSPVSSIWLVSVVFIILGIGMGIAFAALNTGVVKTVSANYIGVASSIFLMCALLGNCFGVTITTMIYQQASLSNLLHKIIGQQAIAGQLQIQQIVQYIANIGAQTHNLSALSPQLQNVIFNNAVNALNAGVRDAMLLNTIVCLIAVYLCAKLLKEQ